MPDWLRKLLLRLPASHNGWTCKWFLSVAMTALVAGVLGLVEQGTYNLVLSALAFTLLGVVVGKRGATPHC